MRAFEARFVITNSISRQQLNRINSLLTRLAFLLRPNKRHCSIPLNYKQKPIDLGLLPNLLLINLYIQLRKTKSK